VVKHAVATEDSRGDQGHFSSAFATFHAAFVLEFEMSLLAIDSSIGAMPYWDGSSTGMFTSSYFGSVRRTGSDNVVMDGVFSDWMVLSTKLSATRVTDSLVPTGTSEAVPPQHLGSFGLVLVLSS